MRPLIALTVAAAALRFATLDFQSFWYDEAVTVELVRMDLSGMLDRIPDSESTPPLYYLLAWLWAQLFGTGEAGLRSLSALVGTVTVPVAYLAGRELVGRTTGLVVAALAAFNPLLVWYSQEARAYALAAMLAGLSVFLCARAVRRRDAGSLALWAFGSALALATHYFNAFVIVPELAWLLLAGRGRPGGRRVGLAVAGVAAAALALLPLALHQRSLDLAPFLRGDPLPERLVRGAKQGLVGFDAPLEYAASALAATIAAGGVVAALRRPASGTLAAAGIGATAVVVPLLLALVGADYFGTRNLLVAWVPLAIVVAVGLAASRPGMAGAGVLCAVGLTAVLGVALTERWQRDDWREGAAALGPAKERRAVVLGPVQRHTHAIRLYRNDLSRFPREPVSVREIALLSVLDRDAEGVHPPPPPRPPAPAFAGFTESGRRQGDDYTIIILRSRGPVPVNPGQLAGLRLLRRQGAAVLLQEPRLSGGAARASPPGAG